jgi:hypothetical protein
MAEIEERLDDPPAGVPGEEGSLSDQVSTCLLNGTQSSLLLCSTGI